ncbi:DUF3800 domain-containing protein [Thioalkalivibrio sp. K90mix]|uniref:DUF3800 domain-containing protein n=1 Tax=Thioalkalivibrio sp. (strain K90mix) TaxID=396595 RepID=UPI001FCB378B|nr:DUF3800 domain-containing protein [Thioalkalivibrio sp. K90mix]
MLFMDESGQDRRDSPYEVLAGVCVEDRDLWNLVCEVQDAETGFFGQRITPAELELKGKKLLKRKTFRLAGQMDPIPPERRSELARACLTKGEAQRRGDIGATGPTRKELTALAQAKIAFVDHLLEICARYRVRTFASIVDCAARRPEGQFLRKDYAYLFERYYHFLEEQSGAGMGVVVFDELEKVQAHILLGQMARYFRETAKGRMRAARVIPEPFFVHSHLTTAVQLADVVAYLVAWGVRVGTMTRSARSELSGLAEKVCDLRFRTLREDGDQRYPLWSFAVIDDLRPREERDSTSGK